MKADKHSPHLSRLQECSRTVNEMAANVVASTKSGQEQVEDRGGHWGPRGGGGERESTQTLTHPALPSDTMDFSGLSLIKLKKQEMETQVAALPPLSFLPARLPSPPSPLPGARPGLLSCCVGLQVRALELEKTLEVERVRLGELRRQHYLLAGAMGAPGEEEPSPPSATPRSATKKPPLAQKPAVAPRQDHQVPGRQGRWGADGRGPGVLSLGDNQTSLTGGSRHAAPHPREHGKCPGLIPQEVGGP